MPEVVINCPVCNGKMRLVDGPSWELEHEIMTLADKAPRSVIARQIWNYRCSDCGSRLDFVGRIAKYKLEEDSIKDF